MSEAITISKEKMLEFIELRDEGDYNMIDPAVREILELSREEHYYLLSHFDELCKKYGINA